MSNTGGERGKMRRNGTVSLGIQGETQPLGMGGITFSAVQEWFDSNLKYPHWHYAGKITKVALNRYSAY